MATEKKGRRAFAVLGTLAIAVAVVAAATTLAIYNAQQATPSSAPMPSATLPSLFATPSATSPATETTAGTAAIELSGATHDRANVPVTCLWHQYSPTIRMAPTTLQLFGESVTVSWVPAGEYDGQLVLTRQGAARYVGPLFLEVGSDYAGFSDMKLDPTDQSPATPFGGPGGPDTITVSVYVKCDWLARPVPSLSTESLDLTRGSAKFSAGAISATTAIDCLWASKTKVSSYSFPAPVELAGENVEINLDASFYGDKPFLRLRREGMWADYTSRSTTIQAEGWEQGTGNLRFEGLALDTESYAYPLGVPMPTPMEWFMKPLGGLAANRTLDGSLAWNCGDAPATAPAVELTPEPPNGNEPSYHAWDQLPWPKVSVRAGDQAAAVEPETIGQCWTFVLLADPSRQLPFGCEGPQYRWYVPSTAYAAKAGTTLTWSVPGYKITSPEMAYASPAEVERWRGGEPDTKITLKPASVSRSSATFVTPSTGDWVVIFTVQGKNAAGDELRGNYAVRIHVTG